MRLSGVSPRSGRVVRSARALALAGGLAAAAAVAGSSGCAGPPAGAAAASPLRPALAQAADPDLRAFYQARGWRPLWIQGSGLRPEAAGLVGMLQTAREDGLSPERYHLDRLSALLRRARAGDASALAPAELALSGALADYVVDLHRPAPGAAMERTDPTLPDPTPSRRRVLEAAARAPTLGEGIADLRRMNPVYERLRAALAADRAAGGRHAALILANLERARAVPTNPGPRYILVDAAAQKLWIYENGRVRASMPVIVGKPSEPTPMMAGVIRYAVFNPYWNIPPDLVRATYAPRVLQSGRSYLQSMRLEAVSGWGPDASPLDPGEVDWAAVAAGRDLRLRQLPGPDNMMGRVKFMLPNRFGVYLHDTPNKAPFGSSDPRTLSSGCVRLSDAEGLARWLFYGEVPLVPADQTDHRVDLPTPVPVFITYFTAWPGADGLAVRHDIYHRDRRLLAALEGRGARA